MFRCDSKLDHPKLWKECFGDLDFVVDIGNVSFIGLATPLLQDRFCPEENHKRFHESTRDFISKLDISRLLSDAYFQTVFKISCSCFFFFSGQSALVSY